MLQVADRSQAAAAAVQCPACGANASSWRAVRSSEPALGPQRFELARCRRCGIAVTLGDAPEGLHGAGAYRPGSPRLFGLVQPLLGVFDRQRLALVRSLAPPPARLLDAGAGRGRFVAAARAAGYEASGIEPFLRGAGTGAPEAASPVARQHVSPASIEDAAIEPGSVDVVTLWHVLEHLEDPGSALSRIRTWLRPGGGLLVGVPNLESLQASLGGEHWYHLDVPRHRVHFTPRALEALLGSHGFDVVGTRHTMLEHNPFGMWQSLVSRFTRNPSYVYNLLKRNAPLLSGDLLISAAAIPLAPLAALVELGADLAGRGGTIAVLARRRV